MNIPFAMRQLAIKAYRPVKNHERSQLWKESGKVELRRWHIKNK